MVDKSNLNTPYEQLRGRCLNVILIHVLLKIAYQNLGFT